MTIRLVNQRPSILDLSSILDVHGVKVVLKPKGQPGDSRECFVDAEQHPDVQAFLGPKWVTVERPSIVPAQKLTAAPVPKKTVVLPAPTPPEPEAPPAELPGLPEAEATPSDAEGLHQIQEPSDPPAFDDSEPEMTAFAGAEPVAVETVEAALEAEDAAPADAESEPEAPASGRRRKKNR